MAPRATQDPPQVPAMEPEEFIKEDFGARQEEWDGARGYKPLGSIRARRLYDRDIEDYYSGRRRRHYSQGQLLGSSWIHIVDNEFAQAFAAKIRQYSSNPWEEIPEDEEDEWDFGTEEESRARDDERLEYLMTVEYQMEPNDPPKKQHHDSTCWLEAFSEWPPIGMDDLRINLRDLQDRAEQCEGCGFLYRCLLRHGLGAQEEIELFESDSVWKLTADKRVILTVVAHPGSKQHSEFIQIGFPELPQVGSDAYFELLRHWLKTCDGSDSHGDLGCRIRSESILPTRVIDVGDNPSSASLRLYRSQPGEEGEYIALSHCWGKLPPPYKERAPTLKCNLSKRLGQIDMEDLPQNFRDAITVTRQLEKRYLWIDSLCIVQDDVDDWEREAKTMERVYSLAYCTLAASSAQDSTVGFLRPRPARKYLKVNSEEGTIFYVCEAIDDFHRDVEQSILNSRGWVLQERCLSRRIIHFTDTQAYWECGIGVHCESLTQMYNVDSYMLGDPAFPQSLHMRTDFSSSDYVESLVKKYTSLSLTKSTDRATAFAGIEKRLAGRSGLQTDVKYGLTRIFLHRGLLWQRADDTTLKRISYPNHRKVPTWSWMAYDGKIDFMSIYGEQVSWSTAVQFPSSSELRVQVREFRGPITRVGKADALMDLLGDEDNDDKRGWLRLDEDDIDLASLKCVVVGRECPYSMKAWKRCYVLVVRPVHDNEQGLVQGYERIGTGFIDRRHVSIDEVGVEARII